MINRDIKSAVLTGPTGAIGTALCRELAENGVTVYAVCRPNSNRAASVPEHKNIRKVFCDLSALCSLKELIPDGADAFYHFGWAHTIGDGRNDMPSQIENISYCIDAVRAANELGCKVFIGAGSQAEYGRVDGVLTPSTPCFAENGYGIAKLAAGNMSRIECEKLGIHHVWVRILSVYGPNDSRSTMISGLIDKLLKGERPSLTLGEQQWDYLYSFDAARAFHLIANSGVSGKTYVLGSGEARPLKCYIEQIRDFIDPALPLGFGEVPYGPKQVMRLQADISELTRDTGFTPETDFAEGIEATVKAFR
ncbi:MAG: NAD(P)-dependent oxidoreductase [Clostridia bacterium]|nr:NAD(P)-dependent oxidoreductase [Clostridia bacterium]